LAEKKQDDELRVKQAAMIVVAKTIRIGTKVEGLWKRGQVSARQADLNSEGLYGQQSACSPSACTMAVIRFPLMAARVGFMGRVIKRWLTLLQQMLCDEKRVV
jgi:hypothetical protein